MKKAIKGAVKKSAGTRCRAERSVCQEPTVAAAETGVPVAVRRAPRPSGCTRFVRREIAVALPSICAMLLSRTMDGDLSALKLLLQMALETTGDKERGGSKGSAGFARKMLAGFREWEAGDRGLPQRKI